MNGFSATKEVPLPSSVKLYHGDCLKVLKTFKDKSVDAVVTDPPYGCGKADWDDTFPTAWYSEAKRIAFAVVALRIGARIAPPAVRPPSLHLARAPPVAG